MIEIVSMNCGHASNSSSRSRAEVPIPKPHTPDYRKIIACISFDFKTGALL